MVYPAPYTHTRAFSLVELLVTAALVSLVFGGLFASVQFALKLIIASKATSSALALANERIEYIRSLSYTNIGTVSGIPNGPIPQNSTTTLNGITFHERVLIEYIDSSDDGIGAADINGILADYKQVKVEYSWSNPDGTSTIFLLTNVVPPGIETTAGGGTLTVNVFDAQVEPVPGAAVRLYNNTTTSTIDTTRFTNTSGVAMFSGAPAAAQYQITVTKADYSTDKTYSATTSNPNPTTPHVAVLNSTVSTMNFQIDELSDLLVRTVLTPVAAHFEDEFSDMSNIALATDVDVDSGDLILGGGSGSYAPSGTVLSTTTNPGTIAEWSTVTWNRLIPAVTSLAVQVYAVTATGTHLIPDSALPGNAAGFTTGPINLSGLNTSTYPALALGATLTTSNPSVTPALHDWRIDYIVSEPSVGNIPFVLTGAKIIGTTASATPISKYSAAHTTDGAGEKQLQDLEWDLYNLSLNTAAYDISETCPSIPYALDPGVSKTLTLILAPATARSLRVSVIDSDGDAVIGARVDLTRSGFSDSDTTSTCGGAFFNSLSSASDYQIDVHASGYVDQTITNINVSGAETLRITLVAS